MFLSESPLPKTFCANAINMACYIMKRTFIRPILNKTPSKLYFGKRPNISHLYVFGFKCYIHNKGKDNLDKFDPKSNEDWFLGYSSSNKAFWVFKQRTLRIEESIHVVFDEFSSSDDKMNNEDDQEEWTFVPYQSSPKETLKKQ